MRTHIGVMLPMLLVSLSVSFGGKHSEMQLTKRKLEQPAEIQGVPCQRGNAWFDESGRLISCFLYRDATLKGAQLPRGTWVYLKPDGHLDHCFLPMETVVQGHRCRGGGHSWMTAFYPSGKLRLCWLAESEEIQGVPCMKAGVIADVFGGGVGTYFHENGNLAQCKIARDAAILERSFKRGEHIKLDPEGKIAKPE